MNIIYVDEASVVDQYQFPWGLHNESLGIA